MLTKKLFLTSALVGATLFTTAQSYADTIWGTDGRDYIIGTGGNDIIYLRKGWDTGFGQNGNDVIYGGNGYDWIFGGHGRDKLWGQSGNDKLDAFGGSNNVLGGGNGRGDLCYNADLTSSTDSWNTPGCEFSTTANYDWSDYPW